MITNIDQLVQIIEQMGRLHRILESYRKDTLPENPRNFLILAQGPLALMSQLQAEIDDYISRVESERAAAEAGVATGSVSLHDKPAQ